MTAAEIHGPLIDPDWASGLIDRVRRHWPVPIADLADVAPALFLRRRIAYAPVLAEACCCLCSGLSDESELNDGELAAAVEKAI